MVNLAEQCTYLFLLNLESEGTLTSKTTLTSKSTFADSIRCSKPSMFLDKGNFWIMKFSYLKVSCFEFDLGLRLNQFMHRRKLVA